jgi:hypothetical protein
MALIDDDAGAPVYDLAVLNEDSVDLRLPVCVELEACDPGRAFEVVDQPYARDFEVSEGLLFGKNELKVLGDDAAVVRLRLVDRQPGTGRRPILDKLAARAATQRRRKREDERARSKSIRLPIAHEVCFGWARATISRRPKGVKAFVSSAPLPFLARATRRHLRPPPSIRPGMRRLLDTGPVSRGPLPRWRVRANAVNDSAWRRHWAAVSRR